MQFVRQIKHFHHLLLQSLTPTFLPRDSYAKRGIYRRRVSVCVCVSVTLRYCIKTAKRRITQITPLDSSLTLAFWCQSSLQNSNGITQMHVEWVKIRHFRRKTRYNSTRNSAIAEGPREALVSRNPATTKHLT